MPNPNHEDKESLIEPLEGLLIDLDFTLYYTKDLVYGGGSEYVLANQHLKDKFQQALTQATERAVGKERGAWINGERCSTCGEPMEKTGLSDTCIRCFEDN